MRAPGCLFNVLGLSLLTAIACGKGATSTSSSTKIVGGSEVQAADAVARSTVALVQPNGWQFCTGTLIAPRQVLTASHCLARYHFETLSVYFGLVAKQGAYDGNRLRLAQTYQVNKEFNPEAMEQDPTVAPPNDIALVTLAEEAPAGYEPVPLLGVDDQITMGEELRLAGFGLTSPMPGSAGVLRAVSTKLVSASATSKEISFGDSPGKSSCKGDSGGPAFVLRGDGLRLIGVTSRGSKACNGEGIYTDVRYFQNWIDSNMAAAL